jgi:hypothetical protein
VTQWLAGDSSVCGKVRRVCLKRPRRPVRAAAVVGAAARIKSHVRRECLARRGQPFCLWPFELELEPKSNGRLRKVRPPSVIDSKSRIDAMTQGGPSVINEGNLMPVCRSSLVDCPFFCDARRTSI